MYGVASGVFGLDGRPRGYGGVTPVAVSVAEVDSATPGNRADYKVSAASKGWRGDCGKVHTPSGICVRIILQWIS